jgi:exoribonuclease II
MLLIENGKWSSSWRREQALSTNILPEEEIRYGTIEEGELEEEFKILEKRRKIYPRATTKLPSNQNSDYHESAWKYQKEKEAKLAAILTEDKIVEKRLEWRTRRILW